MHVVFVVGKCSAGKCSALSLQNSTFQIRQLSMPMPEAMLLKMEKKLLDPTTAQ
jgi:hypothetical protein